MHTIFVCLRLCLYFVLICLLFFYSRQKADPTQFMQIHSRKCKIHLDPAVAAAGDSPAIMQVILQPKRFDFNLFYFILF